MTTGKDKLVRHFKGWPETTLNAGKQTIMIRARYVSPRMYRLRNILFTLGLIAGIGFGVYKIEAIDQMITVGDGWFLLGGVIFAIAFYLYLLHKYCKATALIEFTPEMIRIKKYATMRWGEYERSLPHSFAAELHESAKDEEKRDMAIRRETGKEGEELYRKTFQIYLDHVDGRVYIADVIEKKKATMFLSRLVGVNEFMDTFLDRAHAVHVKSQYSDKKGGGSSGAPVDDDRPGY